MVKIGITGTNGKTTATYFLHQLCERSKVKCTSVSSLGRNFEGAYRSGFGALTPDIIDDSKVVITEVHAAFIDLGCYNHEEFNIVALLNIQEFEHGEHFKNYNHYSKTKLDFIKHYPEAIAIVPTEIYSEFDTSMPQSIYDFGASPKSKIRYTILFSELETCRVKVRFQEITGTFSIPSTVFIPSLCIAFGCAVLTKIVTACNTNIDLSLPQGRYALFGLNERKVIIDYAHNPSGIEAILKEVKNNRKTAAIICVSGCGGDRDKSKRPHVGRIIEEYSDTFIITSDCSRSESFEEIAAGISNTKTTLKIASRVEAFTHALSISKKNDIVVLLGMGGQDIELIKSIINI